MTDEQIIESLKAKLKEAIELAEAAAKTSPYPQTPHFWKRIYDLRHGTNNSN
jgi:TPP-dependent pyruvate/acetoin dehydrogenase alpha subunit